MTSDELEALTRAVTFTCLIGNADAHGKNVSLLHDLDGHIRLAPLYDTVPTALWPNLRSTAAMSLNGKSTLDRIDLHDIAAEASRWGLDHGEALTIAAELTERVRSAVSEVVDHDELATRIAANADRLLDQRPDYEDEPGPEPVAPRITAALMANRTPRPSRCPPASTASP